MKKLLVLLGLAMLTVQVWSQNCRPRNNCSQGYYVPSRVNWPGNYGFGLNNYNWRGRGNCAPGAAIVKNVLISLSNFMVNATIPDNCYYDNQYYYNGNNWYTLYFRDANGYRYQRKFYRNVGQNYINLNWRNR